MSGPGDEARPYLPRGVRIKWCEVRRTWFLLAPERALKLDPVAAAILRNLDRERTFAGVVEALARDYDAPVERIAGDARPFLASLIARRMVEVA